MVSNGAAVPFDQDTQTTSYLIESENIGLFTSIGKISPIKIIFLLVYALMNTVKK